MPTINSISLKNFRSYSEGSFEFNTGVNIIVGPNASGKTNLLESILVACQGVSYRAADNDLISFGADWSRIDCDSPDELRTVKLTHQKPPKQFEINGKQFVRLMPHYKLPLVVFEPNSLLVLGGSPEHRRAYLDNLIEQIDTGYGTKRRNYQRLLSQRNKLLKRSVAPTKRELFPWNLRLSELGAAIARSRAELVAEFSDQIADIYRRISKTTTLVEIKYEPLLPLESYESTMMHKLESRLDDEMVRGFTLTGPHREDFSVYFDGVPMSETASRGEARTTMLTLKIMELKIVEQRTNKTPILLLDDVFSELDGSRRQALTNFLENYQTFITTTDADMVVQYFIDQTKIKIIPID